MNITINSERITAEEYIDFLKKTDLGSQYPKENFDRRIEKLVKNASVSLVARNEHNEIVGVCFGITDFAYWLFITDLGVIRSCTGKGIGRQLIFKALEAAGGEDEIVMFSRRLSCSSQPFARASSSVMLAARCFCSRS